MHFSEVQDAVSRLLYNHPNAYTNVEAVENRGTDILFVVDTSELAQEIEDLKEVRDDLQKDLDATQEKAEALEAERDRLREAADEIKTDDGTSLRVLVERTEQAEKDAEDAQVQSREWRNAKTSAERECTALRARKGIAANLFRQQSEILHVLGQMATYPDDRARWQPRAKELLAKLHER